MRYVVKTAVCNCCPSMITSYSTMHTYLHANQSNKGFNASVGSMNCGCVMR